MCAVGQRLSPHVASGVATAVRFALPSVLGRAEVIFTPIARTLPRADVPARRIRHVPLTRSARAVPDGGTGAGRVRPGGRADFPRDAAGRRRPALAHGRDATADDPGELPVRWLRARSCPRRAGGGVRTAHRLGHRALPVVRPDRPRAGLGRHAGGRGRPCDSGPGRGHRRRAGDPHGQRRARQGRVGGRRRLGRTSRRAPSGPVPTPLPAGVLPQHDHGQRRGPLGAGGGPSRRWTVRQAAPTRRCGRGSPDT